MTSDVTLGSAIQSQAGTSQSATQLAEDFDEFLQLLTIQLQNQDPLSPMDTNEFTNQIVAFTGVEQQINTNQKLDDLVALSLGNAVGQAIGYVGKDISYVSSEFNYTGAGDKEIRYSLNSSATTANLQIIDERGVVVYQGSAGKSVGQNEFIWDGKNNQGTQMPEGTYSVRIDALDGQDQGIASTVVVSGLVSGVESQNGQIFAIVGERAVSLGNILSVNLPQTITQPTTTDSSDETAGDSSNDTTSDETA